jgi:rubredoxin
MEKETIYREMEYGAWECSECNLLWNIENGTPEENEMNYCPKCGKKISEYISLEESDCIPLEDGDEEDE